jgi:hypothetical protein
MSPKAHTHKKCGTLKKKSFSTRGILNSHTKVLFDIRKVKNYCIENPNNEHIF